MLQADFVVPSSREAVDNNNAWNQELRSQLHDLFLKSLAFFKALPSEKHLSWVDCWLQCIPLHGEVMTLLVSPPVEVHCFCMQSLLLLQGRSASLCRERRQNYLFPHLLKSTAFVYEVYCIDRPAVMYRPLLHSCNVIYLIAAHCAYCNDIQAALACIHRNTCMRVFRCWSMCSLLPHA